MKRPQPPGEGPRVWYLLIHQLPARPLYLRAKIRDRLSRAGAVPLKRSVYALPHRRESLEALQAIARECQQAGGDGYLCEARFLDRKTEGSLLERFRSEREADYRALAKRIEGWSGMAEDHGGSPASFAAARKRLDEIGRIDFFRAKGRAGVERLLARIDTQDRAVVPGRTWVTRPGIQVDRIASAWLVRRFVDRKARFRFFDPRDTEPRKGEISFDMPGGDFTHEGDRCTFETLLARTRIEDRALAEIAEIVHDIDLKDGKFGRREAAGVELVLTGLILANPEDTSRLERGMFLLDELYQSFRIKHGVNSKEARS